MRRRDLLAALGVTAVVGSMRPVRAQQAMPRVGILLLSGAAAAKDLALVAELSRLGYVEGRNIAFDIRAAAGDLTRLPALARELAAARPKVLVGSATTSAEALALATRDIPIVMAVLMRARALATVREWKKRLEHLAHSRSVNRGGYGLPVATGAVS